MTVRLAQFGSGDTPAIGLTLPSVGDLVPSVGTILAILGGAMVLVLGVLALRIWVQRRGERERAAHRVVLRLAAPRTVPVEGASPTIAERMAQAEAFAAALWSAGRRRTAFSFRTVLDALAGIGPEPVTLEIVAHGGEVHCLAVVPEALVPAVELAVPAAYPHAQVERVPDYNIFLPTGAIAARAFALRQRSLFPLRTSTSIGQDLLPTLVAALARSREHGGALFQLTLLPAGNSWQTQAHRVARGLVAGPKASGPSALNPLSQLRGSSEFPNAKHEATPADVTLANAIETKASKVGFRANLRLVTAAPTEAEADERLRGIAATFTTLASQESQQQLVPQLQLPGGSIVPDSIYRHVRQRGSFILNAEELTTLFHLPFPGPDVPFVHALAARALPAPPTLSTDGVLLGVNRTGGTEHPVRLALDDRRRHLHIIGATGVGKSAMLANLILQDIRAGHGVGVIDPHGSLVESILANFPRERRDDLVLFEPADTERPAGLNLLEAKDATERDRASAEMVAIFLKLFPPEVVGPMFEHTMRNALLTLMADPDHPNTLVEVPRLLTDKTFRDALVAKVADPLVRAYWEGEQAKTSAFHQSEMLGYVISKVGRFVENTLVRNIIGQARSTIDLANVLDGRRVLLVNLSRGAIGELNADLLGLILVAKIQLAAFARAARPEAERPDFFLYLDEFQHFVTDSVATVLSEARKYRLNLTLAHQYLGQLVRGTDTLVRDAVLANAGSSVAFRVGVDDATVLAQVFAPNVTAYDLANLDRFTAYARILVSNVATPPFTLTTLPPSVGSPKAAADLRAATRERVGRPRSAVEAEIIERARLGQLPPTPPPADVAPHA